MRDIGNRHHQTPAPTFFLTKNGIIEIARRFSINRHQRQIAQVLAPDQIGLLDLVRQSLVFLQCSTGELKGQVMLAQRNLDFHPRISVIAQHFGNPANRLREFARLLNDRHHDDLPGFRLDLRLLFRWHKNILRQAPVLRHHKDHTVFDEDATNDTRIHSLSHFNNTALRPPLSIDPHDTDQCAIAVQHLTHLMLVEKNIGTAIVGNQKAITIGMSLNLARRQARPLGQNIGFLAVAQHLPFALHGAQAAPEHLAFAIVDIEQSGQLFKTQRPPFIRQNLGHIFT